MEEPRDTTLFDGHDHDLVRVEAALSALREEAVHAHGVPWALRDVEAVLAERTPRSGGEFVYLPSQRRDALWATVCSRKGRVEPHDPRRLRRDELATRSPIRREERANS